MASRDLKEHVYIEALEDAITNVEMIENHLERLSDENKVVAMHILRKDRIKTILSLELALSTYCILLRKMQENHFISYSDAIRMDINSIIHSNRFEYYDGETDKFVSVVLPDELITQDFIRDINEANCCGSYAVNG